MFDGLIVPEGGFKVIYADPPWPFRTFSKEKQVPARGAQPYQCMRLNEIAALPLQDVMAKNCAVILWENDSIPGSLDFLTKAWGLRLGTRNLFIWDKGRMGMGYYTRKEGEVAHLLVKGRPGRLDKGVRQIIREPRREHSRKPEEAYARIERLFDGPYLELFARSTRPGWTAWGNETQKFGEAA